MNLNKTYTHTSKVMPGVVITLRRIGPRKRSQIELGLAKVRARQRELRMKMAAVRERVDHRLMQDEAVRAKMAELGTNSANMSYAELARADFPEDILAMINELQETVEMLIALNEAEIQPAFIVSAVVSISDDLTYEGEPATPELLCEYGPSELFDEVATVVNEGVYVAQEVAENLSSPTTSGAQMGGQDSIAPLVNNEDSTASETASGDTPKP